jgi:hypothetical protein
MSFEPKQSIKDRIIATMERHGDSWDRVVGHAGPIDWVVDWYGLSCLPFTVWTESRVYFLAMSDRGIGVESISRNPTDEAEMVSG